MLLREVSWREQMRTEMDFAHRTALPSVQAVSDCPIKPEISMGSTYRNLHSLGGGLEAPRRLHAEHGHGSGAEH